MSGPDARLTEELLDQARTRYGWKEDPVVLARKEIDGPYSQVSRLRVMAGGKARTLYLKRLKHFGATAEQAANRTLAEYRTLGEVAALFDSHERYGVARPVAVSPAHAAILLEEAEGTSLMRLIGTSSKWYARGDQEAMERYCRLAGEWLREFQSLTRQSSREFDLERLVGYCDARFYVLISDARTGIDEPFRARFEAALRRRHQENKAKLDLITGCHHDYSPHNIIAARDRISVIDFGEFDYDCHLYDVCRFWFQLECMKSSPLFRPGRITQLQAAFLSSYGGSIDPRDPAFQLILSAYYLSRLATMTRNGMRGGVRGRVDQRLYKRCLDWLAAQL